MLYRATVVLQRQSLLPEDTINNVLHFGDDAVGTPNSTHMGAIAGRLVTFYQSFQGYLSPALSAASNAHRIRVATVTPNGTGPNDDVVSPVLLDYAFSLLTVGSTTTSLPAEVAVCLSLVGQGAATSPENLGGTRPRARRRGRIYIGPLGQNTLTQGSDGEARVATAFQTNLTVGANTLYDGSVSDGVPWCIYSRAGGTNVPVDKVFVDNAFDTQRRRGIKANARTSLQVA